MRKLTLSLLALVASPAIAAGPKMPTSGGIGNGTYSAPGGVLTGGAWTLNGLTGNVSTPVVDSRPGPAPAYPNSGDCWTTFAGLACRVNGSAFALISRTPTSAALSAMPSSVGIVSREGYYAFGDVSPVPYTASASACPLNGGAGDGGSQVPSSDGKCWVAAFGTGGPDVRQFGAKGDGATDDTVAVQRWVDYLSASGKVGSVSDGQYKLTSTITAAQANSWGFRGSGEYKSAFFYAGSNLSANIFDFGGTGSDSRGASFQNFSVFSFVTMRGGTAFKLTNFTEAVIDNASFGGELYAKNTWNGVWFNGAHEIKMTRFDVQGQHDGIIVNAGSLGNSSNSDLYLNTGHSNNNGGAGIRQAGGFGGLNVDQVQVLGNVGGQLVIDNSVSKATNRETILGPNFVADGVLTTQDNIILNSPNSSSANLIFSGTIGSATRYGINVISWPNSYLNISAGRVFNNQGDGIHLADGTVTLVCGSGASIDKNDGMGVYSSVSNANAYISCPIFANTSGNIAPTLGGWQSYSPTLTAASGSYGTATASVRYTVSGKTVSYRAVVTITANGSAAGSVNITLPLATTVPSVGYGRAANISGKMLQGYISGSTLSIYNYDGSYPGSDGENLVVSGTYEAQ